MRRRHARDESGVFVILYAVLLLGLLGMVAIVIDLSQLRSVRRTSQSVTDFASLAAAGELSATSGGSPVQACQDAFDYVKRNAPDFPAAATVPCGDLLTATPPRVPCSGTTTPPTPPLVMEAAGEAPYDLRIVYPVPASLIDDPRRGGSGIRDGDLCERIQVLLDKTGDSFFSTVFGVGSLKQGASSTARGFVESEGRENPALVILEKEACGALQTSGQGGVQAKGNGIKPGIIAVASAGSVTPGGCSNGNTAGGKVVFGTPLPAGHPRPGQPSIEALEAAINDPSLVPPSKRPPILTVFAMETANSARSAYITPTGVRPAPQGGPRVSRNPVDARYGSGISGLRAEATAPTGYPGTYTRLSTILGVTCRVNSGNFRIAAPNLWIDCDPAFTGPGAVDEIVFEGTNFVTTRNIDVGSGKKWTFTNPRLIVVNRNATNRPAVSVSGQFWVNTGPQAGTAPTTPEALPADYCSPSRNGPGFPPVRFVINDGEFITGVNDSVTKLCQTTLYMANGAASPRPDNDNNSDTGTLSFGGGFTDWTAPDQSDLPACSPPLLIVGCYDSTAAQFLLEDLALWTESAPLSDIGGQGDVFLTGVFFLPNATFAFTGQAVQEIDRNAQFVARKLDMRGKGTLVLKPDPNEAVAFLSSVSMLIR